MNLLLVRLAAKKAAETTQVVASEELAPGQVLSSQQPKGPAVMPTDLAAI